MTGGAGYIGSHACKALARAGFCPVVYDDLSNGHDWAVRWGGLEQGDIRDADRLTQVLAQYRPRAVLHFAGLIESSLSVTSADHFHSVNVQGTAVLLAVMQRLGLTNLVFSSTAAVYGTVMCPMADENHSLAPLTPYGKSKLAAEQAIALAGKEWGLNWSVLRYFNAAGADPDGELGEAHKVETHLIPLAIQSALGQGGPLHLYGTDYATPDGTCMRDYVHVADLASAHVRAVQRMLDGQGAVVLNLGTGQGTSVRQIITAVEQVTGRTVPVVLHGRRIGDPAYLVGDASQARQVLEWDPQHSQINRIVADAWAWHRRQV